MSRQPDRLKQSTLTFKCQGGSVKGLEALRLLVGNEKHLTNSIQQKGLGLHERVEKEAELEKRSKDAIKSDPTDYVALYRTFSSGTNSPRPVEMPRAFPIAT